MVIFGDSITAWNPRKDVVNMGIPGDTTRDMLWRIEEIRSLSEKRVVFMGGINDILMGISRERIVENLEKIVDILKTSFSEVILLSILPIQGSEKRKLEIVEINRLIEDMAERKCVGYIGCHSQFSDDRGELRDLYTTDGIHLSTYGYSLLNNIIDQ